ncbi:MAG: hypothetical protein IJO48_00620 [Clostridia bacterium]|nr:hypothetical protein [Clostridia bacterium]
MKQKINISSLIETLRSESRRRHSTDVLGSYTGTGKKDDIPVQDADDL